MASDDTSRRLLYIADPMCSWCWGFAPVIDRLRESLGERAALTLILGGLFPGRTEPMGQGMKGTVREHWEHVEALTGQPFDYGFFEREGFVYDTEPACRAVVTARALRRGTEWRMLHALHAAFYAGNRDITATETLVAVATESGLDAEDFRAYLPSAAAREQTDDDFRLARELGMRGLPSLMAYDGERIATITEGYQPASTVIPRVEAWLDDTAAVAR